MALTCCEKEQVWAGEGEAVGDRAALFHEKEKQYSQSSGLIGSSRHKLDNEIGTTKDPQRGHKALLPFSRKPQKNRLHMATNSHGKQETSLWGGETCL